MSETPRLYGGDITSNYHGGADTSVEAFESTPTEDRARLRNEVLRSIRLAGPAGATCDDVEIWLAGSHQSISARITELQAEGKIADSGRRRATRTGRSARVYVVAGREVQP